MRIEFQPSLDFVYFTAKEVMNDVVLKENQVIVKNLIFIKKDESENLIISWRSSQQADIIGDCLGYMFYNMSFYEEIQQNENQFKEIFNKKIEIKTEFLIDALGDQFGQENLERNQNKITIKKD